jgi:hypothetical protein
MTTYTFRSLRAFQAFLQEMLSEPVSLSRADTLEVIAGGILVRYAA